MAEQQYINELKEVWEMVIQSFRSTLSESTTELWFRDVQILSYENDLLTLGINSEFKFNIIQNKYIETIRSEFCRLLGFDISVNLTYTGKPVTANALKSVMLMPQKIKDEAAAEEASDGLPKYNFEYTFENFIVGSTNKFAQAACYAVAEHPATNYNPLFIYGNSGLGKTHLMYATINHMKQKNPNIKIIYTKGEDFTNQMIACLANKTMEDFRDKYRKCDVLLIDDIQFIAGKIATQEEFFHTFNALFEEKKQIILTSDRPPRDIKTLEDRLKSRFEWGLIADIEPPDLELRIAIIKNKAEQVHVELPPEIMTFLGENLRSNIRQIEGTIKKLGATAFISGRTVTMDDARQCISELFGGEDTVTVTSDRVLQAVVSKYGVSKEDIMSTKRNKEIAIARHTSIYLIKEMTGMSFSDIARTLNRDHSTVMSSYKWIASHLTDPTVQADLNEIKKGILG